MIESKFIKTVWSINGVIILIAAFIGLLFLVFKILVVFENRNYEYNKGVIVADKKDKAKKMGIDLQHLIYDKPEKIKYTNYYYAPIYVMDKDIPKKALEDIAKANDISRDFFGGTINILFFNKETNETYPLFKDFGFISRFDIPRYYGRNEIQEKDRRKYNIYRIALEDTDGNSRINRKDKSAFYISDLDGKNLKQITPTDLPLSDYWIDDDNLNLIYFERIIEHGDKDQFGFLLKTRILYSYNVDTGEFFKFEDFQSVFDSLQTAFRN